MTFGENLQFLRKRSNMTQEALAEKMEVSRQSVSKWESNSTYPEMDAIIRLCNLFSCDIDTLLRGDVSLRFGEDAAAYDQHMNAFSASIAAGVALVLLGVIFSLILVCFFALETAGEVIFFLFLIAAVTIFIVSGMNHNIFMHQHPGFVPCYTKEEMNRFERRFPFLIAVPVALILLGLLVMIPMDMRAPAQFNKEQWDALCGALFLLLVTISVSTLIWAGIQHSKYGFPEEPQTPAERRAGRIWGFGMLAATAVYVGLGLAMYLWDKAWVIYPVAALVCAAFTVLLKKDDEP